MTVPSDPCPVELRVFSYKQGLLSSFGHDLVFAYTGTARLTAGQVQFEMDPAKLRLLGAAKSTEPPIDAFVSARSLTTPVDTKSEGQILQALTTDVLRVRRFPKISFEGTFSGNTLEGQLEIVGERRPLRIECEATATGASGSIEVAPSEWGIPPYRAMLGALKIQDRVSVRFKVQAQLVD